jgi:glyoxylase-like metal-dependent hydrolase (beta-lactamase superfamily II)
MGIASMDLLVLTHAHHDHAGNAAAVKETFGCRVLVHQQGEDFLVRGRSPMVRATGPISKLMMACFGRFVLPKLRYPPCIPDIVAEERYDFKADGLDIAVIHTPGHTACSLSVIVDGEVALVGDTLFGVFKKSVMPPFANDMVQLKESWRKLLDSGCSVFLPGHGKPVEADRIRTQLN